MTLRSTSLAFLVCTACSRPAPSSLPPRVAPPAVHTVAHELLALEGAAVATPPAMVQALDELLADVAAAPLEGFALNEREVALATFLAIDRAMQRHHFVYPADGYPSATLHDALRPVHVDAGNLELLALQPENGHRKTAIESSGEDSFHLVGSDAMALLYVAAGQVRHLPVALVELPIGQDGRRGVYVHWRSADGLYEASWNPVTAKPYYAVTANEHFRGAALGQEEAAARRSYGVPLTPAETQGFGWLLVADLWRRRADATKMHAAYERSRQLRPASPTAFAEEAWTLATAPEPQLRNATLALDLAKRAMTMWPSASSLDTLAAAYAAAGLWEDAVRTQRDALAALGRGDARYSAARARLVGYENQELFVGSPAAEPALRKRPPPTRSAASDI